MSKPSLRIYEAELEDGRMFATLMRTRESFFDAPPPSAYGRNAEECRAQLEDALRLLLARRTDELSRYLWTETFHTRTIALTVHPSTTVKLEPVVGVREIPLRLTYAWSELPNGAFRVMLPRFRWWLMLEDLSIAHEVVGQAVSGALIAAEPSWIYDFRHQGEERVEEWAPDWIGNRSLASEPTDSAAATRPSVSEIAEDWVERAARKKLPRVAGSDPVFDENAHRFLHRTRPSVLLVGGPGVGKTTFVRRLAKQLLRWKRGGTEAPRRLWGTSADRILAGMIYLGQWQERCFAIREELEAEDEYLYVDRLVDLLRPQHDGSSIAELFAPAVSAGRMPLIAECTEGELVEARRRAARFVDAFHVIRIEEPPASRMIPLLHTEAERRGLSIHPAAIERMIRHLGSFERHRRFPGKAFHALEWLAKNERRALTPGDVSASYARYSGLPLDLIADERSATVAELAQQLRAGVIGQDEACRKAAQVLARLKAGLSDPERPIGTLLFVGPTGVGKTELAKQLTRVLFGDADRMIRVDLSEYMLPGSAQRLIRAGRGVTSLAEQVHRQPLSVVLLDEIEKAHPEVFDLLLGVFGEGRLTDALGRHVDFRMTVLVATSNLGAAEAPAVGFDAKNHGGFERAVREFFRPEFVNRIDHVIGFEPLTPVDLIRIVDLELARSLGRPGLRRRNLQLLVEPAARAKLAELGFHRARGARPLRRVIEERVFTPLAARIAADPLFRDRRVTVVLEGDEFVLVDG